MKKIIIFLCTGFVLFSAFAGRHHFNSGIHGMIDPADGAKKIWAISGTDSVSTFPVPSGFSIEVKPGNWTLVIEAASPYKNFVMQNINVAEGGFTDVGVIKLKTQ